MAEGYDGAKAPMSLPDLCPPPSQAVGPDLLVGRSGTILTYEQAFEGSLRVAATLLDLNLPRGGFVAVDLPNGPLFVTAFFGVLRAGGVAVLGRPGGQANEKGLPNTWRISSGKGSDRSALPRLALEVSRDGASGSRSVLPFPGGGDADLPFGALPELAPDDDAVVLFTSGSSGVPRGLIKTHRNLLVEVDFLSRFFGQEARRFLSMLPWTYIYGLLHHLFLPMRIGAVVETLTGYTPRSILKRIQDHGIDVLVTVPSVLRAVSLLPDLPSGLGLRWVVTSGGPIDRSTVERLGRSGVRLVDFYGSTETGGITVNPDKTDRPAASGSILPYLDVDTNGQGSEAGSDQSGDGASGRIRVRGPSVSARVFEEGRWTPLTTRDGWLTLEDEGRLDGPRQLTLERRSSRVIKVDSHRVSLDEIEQRMLDIDGVRDAAATAIPDPIHGDVPVVTVVVDPRNSWTERALLEECIRRFLPQLRPRSVHIVDHIERQARSKVVSNSQGSER